MYDPRLDSVIIHPPTGRNIYARVIFFLSGFSAKYQNIIWGILMRFLPL